MLFGFITPLFSIHSNTSCYFGDFADLKKLIQLTASLGANYLQILPLQDTNGFDSPYSLNSWMALDIRYLYVEGLERTTPLTIQEQIALKRAKMLTVYQEKKDSVELQKKLSSFKETHPWVIPYACFRVLQDQFHHQPWHTWELPYRDANAKLFQQLESTSADPIHFEIFIQMECFKQLEEAGNEAKRLHVALCCDLPHFCQRNSAEGWNNPSLFFNHSFVGAPPDPLARDGQNWHLAPWNWTSNPSGVLKLWQDRNLLFADYFTHARIDHAIGLFRQWIIPEGKLGRDGAFEPKELQRALNLGKDTFMKLKAKSLLLIAENLGTIPPEANKILSDLKIIGTIVFRWNRSWQVPGSPFIPLKNIDPENLISFTTHDTTSIEGWAQSEWKEFELFCKSYSLPLPSNEGSGKPLIDISLRGQLLSLLQSSPCKIKADLIEEFLLLEEGFGYEDPYAQQVNDPANPQKKNWSYRTKVDLDTLAKSTSWRNKIEKIIASKMG